MKNALVHAAVVSCLAGAVHAAAPGPVPEQLLACSKLQDESARVRCYDEQIAAMNAAAAAAPKAAIPSAPASPSVPTTPAAAVSASAPAPTAGTAAPAKSAPAAATMSSGPVAPQAGGSAQEFGKESLPVAKREKRPVTEDTLVSTITDIHSLGSIYLISLANGQVWRQEGSSSVTSFFRTGYDVKIERAMMGSYQMSTPQTGEKNWVHVTRVR
jgi:hypothetical protein